MTPIDQERLTELLEQVLSSSRATTDGSADVPIALLRAALESGFWVGFIAANYVAMDAATERLNEAQRRIASGELGEIFRYT